MINIPHSLKQKLNWWCYANIEKIQWILRLRKTWLSFTVTFLYIKLLLSWIEINGDEGRGNYGWITSDPLFILGTNSWCCSRLYPGPKAWLTIMSWSFFSCRSKSWISSWVSNSRWSVSSSSVLTPVNLIETVNDVRRSIEKIFCERKRKRG